ncbi:hypothetical protein [Plantibacter sp. YIM 135249]|uniref:hypothetical protein n=1 Tax=Plantibacter sp. YIM 135249 TaxID=3423918 RepID=UPI003D325634
MSLTVTRVRITETGELDRYGKPILTKTPTTHTAFAFAPTVAAEINEVEQDISTDGGSLYFRAPNLIDVRADDQFIVRGVTYNVEGPDVYWEHPDNTPKGNVVILTRAEATHG